MGSGITLVAASNGFQVRQIDVSTSQLERARGYHQKTLARNVEKQRMTQTQADDAASRIRYFAALGEAREADFAVEAASENATLKRTIFSRCARRFATTLFWRRTRRRSRSPTLPRRFGKQCRGDRHALLQPGPGDEARRGHQRTGDERGDDRRDDRAGRAAGQDGRSPPTTAPGSSPTAC